MQDVLATLFLTAPFAIAAAWIVHRIMRARERLAVSREEFERLREHLEALTVNLGEVQERLDFTERVLSQLRASNDSAVSRVPRPPKSG
jgi:predicted  nucleic acid-binding Zn-ribbon protein